MCFKMTLTIDFFLDYFYLLCFYDRHIFNISGGSRPLALGSLQGTCTFSNKCWCKRLKYLQALR